jgi:hypothetical protein
VSRATPGRRRGNQTVACLGRYVRTRPPRVKRAPALALLAVAFAAAMIASTARADGDPASDYLLTQKVFFPYDTKFPLIQQGRFSGLVEAANRAGFKLRVALIGSRYDMGSVTALYLKPRKYARFLGTEISFLYKQRLLVVMPNGLGYNWPGHSPAAAYAILNKIPVKAGPAGFLDTAQTAVQRLTAAAGVKVTAPPDAAPAKRHNSHTSLPIVAAAVAALLLAAAAALALRRRQRQPP